ncbi:MAG: S1/P1 Nuclease [Terrimonas sp.]|nr:S1/P1 Nuclease [Terrimonas sp.]
MKTYQRLVTLFLFLYLPFSSMAWGVLGHRIIGQIAEDYLTAKAKRNISALLGGESLAMTSNWADFIKSDPSFNFLGPWHYINLKDGLSESEFDSYLETDNVTDLYTKLNFIVASLKKKELPRDSAVLYLRLLIHLTGDLHQPMHVSRAGDQGGNKIDVFWFNEKTNLHRLWDEQLIGFQQLSYTEYADYLHPIPKSTREKWQQTPVSTWFYESYSISQRLYSEIIAPDMRLSFRYNFDHIATLNEQLQKGGVRLAKLLNEIFG